MMINIMKRSALSALATALLTATIIQIGCASTTDTTKETNTPKIAEDLYISFCTTNEVKRQPETFESHVYTYGLQSGEVSEMGVVPYNSGYPLAVYSAKDKQIYYSYRENEKNWRNSPPQLYSYDPATKKATQLTDNLAGMNYIVPQKDKVILVASSIEEENLLPYVYERGKGASLVSGWNKDLGIRKLYINPNNEEAICSAYSSNERNNRFEYQTDEYPFEEPPESVYSLLGKDKVGTRRFDAHDEVVSLAQDADGVICCTSDYRIETIGMSDDETDRLDSAAYNKFMHIDKENGERKAYSYGGKLEGLTDFVYITEDSRHIFFIRNGGDGSNELCRYDVSSGETNVIYFAKYGYEELNNAVILAY